MFSMCSQLTPRAHIPDTRIPQLMQPWMYIYSLTRDGDVFLVFKSLARNSFLKRDRIYTDHPPYEQQQEQVKEDFLSWRGQKFSSNQNEGLFPYLFKGHGVNLGQQCSGVASAPGESDKTCGVVPTMGTDLHIVQLIEMKVQSRRF